MHSQAGAWERENTFELPPQYRITPGSHAVRGNPYWNAPAFRDAGASFYAFPRTA